MKKSLTTLSLLALCAVSFGSPAKATIVYVTVTGTVASGSDGSNLFGGGILTGAAYIAQYEFNTSLGDTEASTTENYASGGSAYLSYFPPFNAPPYTISPSLGASLTINGHSFAIAGTYSAQILGENTGSFSESISSANDSATDYLENQLEGSPGDSPASINKAFSITSAGESNSQGLFDDGATLLYLVTAVYTESLTTPTTVPEPASMALLGVGLLGILVMARRRRLTHSM